VIDEETQKRLEEFKKLFEKLNKPIEDGRAESTALQGVGVGRAS
jgi:hypothetical protein